MTHPIENIMKSTMEEIRSMVDVNTVIGNPILPGAGPMILPVSRVSLGFLSGGGEYRANKMPVRKSGAAFDSQEDGEKADARYPFAGTAVAGMSITPIAFLSVNGGCVKVLPAQYKTSWDRVIDLFPEAVCAAERLIADAAAQPKEEARPSMESEK